MAHRLDCRPEQELPVAVLRVTGALDAITAHALRSALLRTLAAQPDPVLVDAAGLRVQDPAALGVLAEVAREAAAFPAVPLMVCAPPADVAARLAADGVPVFADREQALADARSYAAPQRLRIRLRPAPAACRQARALVAEVCDRWQAAGLVSTAAVVVTELVANVVRHARTGMELTLGLKDGRLHIAVRDRSARMPRPSRAGLSDPGGRGLHLVRDLTEQWGVLPVVDGKVVWASITTA